MLQSGKDICLWICAEFSDYVPWWKGIWNPYHWIKCHLIVLEHKIIQCPSGLTRMRLTVLPDNLLCLRVSHCTGGDCCGSAEKKCHANEDFLFVSYESMGKCPGFLPNGKDMFHRISDRERRRHFYIFQWKVSFRSSSEIQENNKLFHTLSKILWKFSTSDLQSESVLLQNALLSKRIGSFQSSWIQLDWKFPIRLDYKVFWIELNWITPSQPLAS